MRIQTKKKTTEADPGQLTSGTNTFVLNDINIHPGSKFRLGSMKRKKNNTAKMEEMENHVEEPVRFQELEGVLTLGEQKALERKESE